LKHLPNRARRLAPRAAWIGALLVLAGCAGTGPVVPGAGGPAGAPVVRAPSGEAPSPGGAPGPSRPGPAAVPSAPAPQAGAAPGPAAGSAATVPVPAPAATAPAPLPIPAPAAAPQGPAVVVAAPRPADAHRDLWQRLRAGFAMPELDSPLVAEKERFYLQRPEALQRMFARGSRYLHYIVEEVEKRGMPTEIALLPFVESAMNPVALSSAQAAGLWQFIPSTGRQYELAQNWWVDNRRDVVKSTQAALDYLQKIHEMHDRDWFLALASYNWGENAVARAVRNNRAKGLPTDYPSLAMPAETRHYVPKLIALKHIVMRPDAFGIALPEIPNRPYFATIEKTRPIDLKLAAQFAGLGVDEFVALNPAHNRPVIAASRNNAIRIPADRVDEFVRAIERHDRQARPLASWQPYTLKPGESLDDVARRGHVTTAELLRANGLSPGRRLLPGTQLIAPQASVKDERQVESFEGPKVYEQVSVPAPAPAPTRRAPTPARRRRGFRARAPTRAPARCAGAGRRRTRAESGRSRPDRARPARTAERAFASASRRLMPCAIGPCATSSPARRRGFSDANGSWNTICTRRVAAAQLAPRHRRQINIADPMMCPPSGSISRTMQRASVDLPEPDSPTMPRVAPLGSSSETWSSALVTRARGRGSRRCCRSSTRRQRPAPASR
jgi:membrane-bound lytic murein transglycosylase D